MSSGGFARIRDRAGEQLEIPVGGFNTNVLGRSFGGSGFVGGSPPTPPRLGLPSFSGDLTLPIHLGVDLKSETVGGISSGVALLIVAGLAWWLLNR